MNQENSIFDSEFLRWVYRASLAVWGLLALGLLGLGVRASLGFAMGGGLSILLLCSQEQLAKACVAKQSSKRRFLFLSFLKYPAIVAILFFLLKYQAIHLWTLCLGIPLVPAVISVKAIAMAVQGDHSRTIAGHGTTREARAAKPK